MSTIEIKNVGPVSHLSFPVPEAGGVVVLHGRNGSGKTRSLEAIESAISGRGKVDVRDGQLRGEVDAFGVSIKVGRSTRRTGELEVSSLDGKLSVAELVDPGLIKPEAADARRIKALIQLSGVTPSPELFYGLVGGRERFDAYISAAAATSDDLVVMAERIKRDLEAAARKEESQAEHADGRARGARESTAGIDLSAECDQKSLQVELETAIREESRLKSESAAEMKARMAAGIARTRLAEAERVYQGPSVAEAIQQHSEATQRQADAEKGLRDAEEALRVAQAAKDAATKAVRQATAVKCLAEQHEAMVAEWRQAIDAGIPAAPTPDRLVAASQRVTAAREAVEQGALIRAAQERAAEADRHAAESVAHQKVATELREAAKLTDEVLSEAVGRLGCKLRVEAGRLVLDTARGVTYFAELSHGERWKLALDIAIDAVGERGVLTVPQEAWEGCDDFAREAIVEHVRGTGVVILTAECSRDSEVVAEVLE